MYDGLGGEPYPADVALAGDRIAAVGRGLGSAERTIDATGLTVAPGFINMLSWATESLIEDGRSQTDIRRGATINAGPDRFASRPEFSGTVPGRRPANASKRAAKPAQHRCSAE